MKTSKPAKFGPQTQAIHGGEPNRRGVNGPIVTEIIRSSTFTFSSTEEMKLWAEGKNKAYIYTRYGNPTLTVAQKKIAALEGAEAAIVTSSGMAAISSALLAALKAGDEVITTAQTYGGTYRLMRDVFPNIGITVRQVGTDLAGIESLITPRSKVLYVETPTNPTLRLVDIHKAVAFAKKHKLVSIIDNTFATPILQNPIAVGKFLENHSKVERVHYPGLQSHADHRLARKQMRGYGGMLAFDMKGGLPAARRFCDRVRLFLLAASLGGVESLVILPAYSSHYNMTDEELRRAGVSPGTVRVSIGLEDKEDLIEDLKQALS